MEDRLNKTEHKNTLDIVMIQ